MVVFIEINLEFVPDGLYKSILFFRDALGLLWSTVFFRFFRFRFGPKIKIVAEVLPDKINKLLEGDESVMISVKFLKYKDKIISARFILDEVTSFSDEGYKLIKRYPFGFPNLAVGGFISPVEEDFDKVD